mmetsp:Transcript_43504/g.120389  ORF Transcript_43504/g.120389 Transcript_43504/m.120389 type:complete len:224 (+) Transcript_43504:191-862(+)
MDGHQTREPRRPPRRRIWRTWTWRQVQRPRRLSQRSWGPWRKAWTWSEMRRRSRRGLLREPWGARGHTRGRSCCGSRKRWLDSILRTALARLVWFGPTRKPSAMCSSGRGAASRLSRGASMASFPRRRRTYRFSRRPQTRTLGGTPSTEMSTSARRCSAVAAPSGPRLSTSRSFSSRRPRHAAGGSRRNGAPRRRRRCCQGTSTWTMALRKRAAALSTRITSH